MRRANMSQGLTQLRKKQYRLTDFFGNNASIESRENITKHIEFFSETSVHQQLTTSNVSPIEENNCAGKSLNSVVSTSGKGKRKFQESWLKQLMWLQYHDGIAKCAVCNMFPDIADKTSRVVTGFSGPFKLETFKKYGKSVPHTRCEEAENAQSNPQSAPLAKCVKLIDENMLQHMHTLFTASYHIAKNNRPYTDLNELTALLSKLNVTNLEQYTNEKRCQEFIAYIASVVRADLLLEIKESAYVSILLDGSTDKSDEEEIILYVRFVRQGKVKETFLAIVSFDDATSAGYLEAVEKELLHLGLEELLTGSNLIGIGTDGAATMIGIHHGLVAKMSQKLDSLVSVHCIAHQLQLTVLQSVKNIKFIEELDSTIRKIYKFYRHSPKRLWELKKISELLECEISKLQYLYQVRWVASKIGALNVIVKDWKCLVIHLESIAERKAEEGSVAKGSLKKIRNFRFVITIHFLHDYLNVSKKLSLIFQRQDLILSQILVHVNKAVSSLEQLKNTSGSMEAKFISNTTLAGMYQDIQLTNVTDKCFASDKANLLSSGIKFLQERFLKKKDIHNGTGVFDTFSWPSGKNLENYGDEEIKNLANHFLKHLNINEDGIDSLLSEWYEFKVLGQDLNFSELLEKSLTMKTRFPILNKLLSIVATMPVSTSSCERGFSNMNLIKHKLHTELVVKNFNDLMISLNGPSIQDFDPAKFVDRWYFSAKTQRHLQG